MLVWRLWAPPGVPWHFTHMMRQKESLFSLRSKVSLTLVDFSVSFQPLTIFSEESKQSGIRLQTECGLAPESVRMGT